jgi:hypothetical protein
MKAEAPGGLRVTPKGQVDEDWSVDIMFIKRQLVDDLRPASQNGGGTGF